jgi:8-oxo-dGTP pyrophosphatase MutT (NUDIX family)
MPERIRPIVIGLIIYNDKLFVFEGFDRIKSETFYRPLGGSIEFGERGEVALIREFKEELDTDIINVTYLTTSENIFTYEGKPHHEIVMIYLAEFADKIFYKDKDFIGHEDNGEEMVCSWRALADFIDGDLVLYPDGLTEFIKANFT